MCHSLAQVPGCPSEWLLFSTPHQQGTNHLSLHSYQPLTLFSFPMFSWGPSVKQHLSFALICLSLITYTWASLHVKFFCLYFYHCSPCTVCRVKSIPSPVWHPKPPLSWPQSPHYWKVTPHSWLWPTLWSSRHSQFSLCVVFFFWLLCLD